MDLFHLDRVRPRRHFKRKPDVLREHPDPVGLTSFRGYHWEYVPVDLDILLTLGLLGGAACRGRGDLLLRRPMGRLHRIIASLKAR